MKLSKTVSSLLASLLVISSIAQDLKSLQVEKNELEKQLDVLSQQMQLVDSAIEENELASIQLKMQQLGYPLDNDTTPIVNHAAFSLQYAEAHEQAKWVMHMIIPKIAEGAEGRTNDFRVDKQISTSSSEEADFFLTYIENDEKKYDGFGYDRGHLAPSADFRWSSKALSESFYYSNMSPQLPEFNREVWADLESLVRSYVIRTGNELVIITGPVLTDNLEVVERSVNQIKIPKQFYKVLYSPAEQMGIAFLLPHQKCESALSTYSLPIKRLENITGLNFLSNLDNQLASQVESKADFYAFFPTEEGDVQPIAFKELNKNEFNTEVVNKFIGMKKTICGTVVSTYKSKKGNVFINLDKRFPNAVFSINIWSSNMTNFSYNPEEYFENRRVCVSGKISTNDGVANVSVENEKQIWVIDELN